MMKVQPGDFLMIRTKLSTEPFRVRALSIHHKEGFVKWIGTDGREEGRIPIDTWEAMADVQRIIAENPGLILPVRDDPATVADTCINLSNRNAELADALTRIGRLTEIVERVESLAHSLTTTNTVANAGLALRKIKQECEAALNETFEVIPV